MQVRVLPGSFMQNAWVASQTADRLGRSLDERRRLTHVGVDGRGARALFSWRERGMKGERSSSFRRTSHTRARPYACGRALARQVIWKAPAVPSGQRRARHGSLGRAMEERERERWKCALWWLLWRGQGMAASLGFAWPHRRTSTGCAQRTTASVCAERLGGREKRRRAARTSKTARARERVRSCANTHALAQG